MKDKHIDANENKSQRDSGLFEEMTEESDVEDNNLCQPLKPIGYDNMAFNGNDDVKPKQKFAKTSKDFDMNRSISPEDLEERLTKFDFADELREEMKNNAVYQKDDDRTLTLSDFDTRRDHHVSTPAGVDEIPDLPADETEKHPQATGGKIFELDDIETEQLEGAVGPALLDTEEGLHIVTESSSSSSSENEVFDNVTGQVVPWEIRSQFTRQFSDSFIDQQGKDLEKSNSNKSLDLGEFYRRDHDKDSDIGFSIDRLEPKGSSDSSSEISPTLKKKSQRVRFSLSEDHAEVIEHEEIVHSYDLKMNEEWKKAGDDQLQVVDAGDDSMEPHNKITDAYQKAVIASIIELRILNEQERQREIEEFENLGTGTPELLPKTEVKVTGADTVVYSSIGATCLEYTDDEDVVEEEYESDKDEVEMVNTMIQTVEFEPLAVVSWESRKAHEELLKESFDEVDRSMSPSMDSKERSTTYENQKELKEELDVSISSRKYLVTVQVQGKDISDNETYESSETDRETNDDERLSPIEETSGDEARETKTEKRVTFMQPSQHLGSASSEELFKTSTSSSEVEPTLLAASYDLDSGKVSHVVTSYDLSPDTVEKQFLPVAKAPKTILSSPEDDVFEADVTIEEDKTETVILNEQTPTEADVEILPHDFQYEKPVVRGIDSASTGTSSIPSPPAPSPFEGIQRHDITTSDLQGAVLKMRALKGTQDSFEAPEVNLDLPPLMEDSVAPDDEVTSPFEIMSHSDLAGCYGEQMEKCELENTEKESVKLSMDLEIKSGVTPSAPTLQDMLSPDKSINESSFEHSSPISSEPSEKGLESPFDIPSADDIQMSLNTTQQEPAHEEKREHILQNGPTEVEYNPEIDLDFSGPTFQPPVEIDQDQNVDHNNEQLLSQEHEISEDDEQSEKEHEIESLEEQVEHLEKEELLQEKSQVLHEVVVHKQASDEIEVAECQATSERNLLAQSQSTASSLFNQISTVSTPQTALTGSLIEELPVQSGQDVLVISDQTLYGLEMPTDEAVSMTASHIEVDSLNTSLYASVSAQDDTSGQIDSKDAFGQNVGMDRTEEDLSERPSESLRDVPDTEESHDTIEVETLTAGEVTTVTPLHSENHPLLLEESPFKEGHKGTSYKPVESELDVTHLTSQIESDWHAEEMTTLKGYEISMQDLDELDLERRTPETFLDDDLDEELEHLKGTPDIDLEIKTDVDIGRSSVEVRSQFELKADSCDLDRPLTPTPVNTNQGFFSETFTPDEAGGYEKEFESSDRKDRLLEKTAYDFVENVLEEVKVKVRYKSALDIEDDLAVVQSPLSENGGDMTDFAEDLPFDDIPDESEELLDFKTNDAELELQEIDRFEEHIEQQKKKYKFLVKQFSEDIPEITPTQRLHNDEEDAIENLKDEEEENIMKEDLFLETKSTKPLIDYSDSAMVCVPEEADDEDKCEEIIGSVQAVSLEGSIKKSSDVVDSGKVCIPEEEDIEPEITKSATKQHDATSVYRSMITEKETESSVGFVQEESEQNNFLGKSSDSDAFLDKSNRLASEQELKSERFGKVISIKADFQERKEYIVEFKQDMDITYYKPEKPRDQSKIDQDHKSSSQLTEDHYPDKNKHAFNEEITITKQESKFQKTEKQYTSSTTIPIPLRKSLSSSSADSFDDDRSAGTKSAEFEDGGDSSSVDSFTTVVAADEEHDDEDRMADFASMTSSVHSDIQGSGPGDDDDFLESHDPLKELIAWAQDKKTKESFHVNKDVKEKEIMEEQDKLVDIYPWDKSSMDVKGIMPHPWRKDDEDDNDSIGGSDKYDYVDRAALSVITELSEEDRFEIIGKEDLESESTGTSSGSRHYSSPDFPPPSPMSILKFFSKSGEKDDISVSSSLLEFERLEMEINHSRSSGSIETGSGSKDSLGGSLDEAKFLSKSLERDDISVSSSLSDFERLEREVGHGSSDNSFGKMLSPIVLSPPEIGKGSEKSSVSNSISNSVSGSLTSLTEFERLEKEFMNDESRRSTGSVASSFSHISIQSITSSQASLSEFERLEQEYCIAEELEREAQKIVSFLESGSLLPNQYFSEPDISYTDSLITTKELMTFKKGNNGDIDRDSIDGRDEIEDDSLSENKKKVRGDGADDTDSLDGDKSDMTSSITSAILKSESATRLGTDIEGDSLHDSTHSSEGAMKISSDSMKISSDSLGERKKDKYDPDSLTDHDGIMAKSAESIELKDGIFVRSTDSIELKSDVMKTSSSSGGYKSDQMGKSSDSLEIKDNVLMSSTDSLEIKEKDNEKFDTDSLHENRNEAMEASVDSLESYQIIPKYNTMEVSMDSAGTGTGWSSASSMFSRSSIDTMRSAERDEIIERGHVTDEMAASVESLEQYEEAEEECDNFYIISKYHSSLKEAEEMAKHSTSGSSELANPYLDFEGNVEADNYQYMMTAAEWNQQFGKGTETKSPYLAKMPYEEKKKIYTMTEWEAMKKARKQETEEDDRMKISSESTEETKEAQSSIMEKTLTTSTLEGETDSGFVSVTRVSKRTVSTESKSFECSVQTKRTISEIKGLFPAAEGAKSQEELRERQQQRMLSIDDDDGTTEYDPHEHAESLRHGIPDHFAQKKGPVFIDPQYVDSEEDEVVDYQDGEDDEGVDGAEGGDTQTTRITMKKEIHTKTVLRDGQEQTFVSEDSQVETDPNAPEELRESMQQIIDEFMGSPTGAQKPLEHDV